MREEYVWFLSTATPVAVLILAAIRLKFKSGLATKMFFAVIPLVYVTGAFGYYAGTEGTLAALVVGVAVVATMTTAVLLVVYRAIVLGLQRHVDSLAIGASQIGSTAKQSAATASQQATTVAEVTTTVEEITHTSSASAAAAARVLEAATKRRSSAKARIMRTKSGMIIPVVSKPPAAVSIM